ncbi:MAG: class I SAM-dependent methyltransferase [Vicinamibacterales bacterium]
MADDRLIRNISDTALWVAHYRAVETERPDAHFKDPHARALAGERGLGIAKAQKWGDRHSWSFITRTVLFDRFIVDEVRAGADLVLNLAAGLDTRPYRMDLPRNLRWVEVDLPDILDYKESIIGGAAPVCRVERVRLDLADESARRTVFREVMAGSARAVVVTEGLLIYLEPAQVASLARDLRSLAPALTWIIDIASPGLVKMMSRGEGRMIAEAGAPFKFAPEDGAEVFAAYGWRAADVASLLKAAAKLRRLPPMLRFFALFPDPKKPPADRPWSAVVRLQAT